MLAIAAPRPIRNTSEVLVAQLTAPPSARDESPTLRGVMIADPSVVLGQRIAMIALTVLPLLGVAAAMWGLWGIVDPIDGTSNFVSRLPYWCISVALAFQGHPVLGIVDAPVLGRRYVATLGAGTFLESRTTSL